jgi:hypothetical protein
VGHARLGHRVAACFHGCLHRNLKRNPALRLLIGIEAEDKVPDADNMSRFLTRTPLNIVYDQAGTVFCYDRVSETPVRQPMAYIGQEAERGTLKYRCPARHHGFDCPSDTVCNGEREYGLTVRVKQEIDLRRFPSIPRATKQFERLYAGRTAVERVNGRLKIFWGIDDGQVYGARRFHGHVGAVMVVHLAFATLLAQTERREGTYGKMKLSPIAKALRELIAAAESSIGDATPA